MLGKYTSADPPGQVPDAVYSETVSLLHEATHHVVGLMNSETTVQLCVLLTVLRYRPLSAHTTAHLTLDVI